MDYSSVAVCVCVCVRVCVCAHIRRLKINIVICVCGVVGEIGGGYWEVLGGPPISAGLL